MKKLLLATLMLATIHFPANATTATYYASHYHGKRTASGIRFNKNAYYAAHRSLAFGTRLRVTNRRNGKSVVVKIVDRCRCSLDLSPAAFRRLAPLSAGRISVRLKIVS